MISGDTYAHDAVWSFMGEFKLKNFTENLRPVYENANGNYLHYSDFGRWMVSQKLN